MYVICSEVRFVEFSSPNECDKILKIPNEQTEPTDYMANCSKDSFSPVPLLKYYGFSRCYIGSLLNSIHNTHNTLNFYTGA